MRYLVINNIASGSSGRSIYDFIRYITEDGDEIVIRSTDGKTDLRTLLTDAASFDAVIASGGDGTISTVAYCLAYTGVPILPFPAGTGNLLCQNLESTYETHNIAKLLKNGVAMDFDIGELLIDGNRYGFCIMAGAGYDAVIMRNAQVKKHVLGPVAYFAAGIESRNVAKTHLKITVDGTSHECDALGVLLINFSKIQFDISITHNNMPRDGYLDVAIMKGENAFDLLPALGAALKDLDGSNPSRTDSVELLRGRRIRIEAEPPLEIQYDGEPTLAATPFEARILPKAARFLLTPESAARFREAE